VRGMGLLSARNETPEDAKHNLPWQTTLFVGRHQEMSELARLLSDPDIRLITILGAGGMGKTRLALEVARAHLGHFADGVYFVPLAPLSSSERIGPAIAESVGFRFYEERDPQAQLLRFLAGKRMLLVLDNFEHLLDGAGLVTEMLQAAPSVKVLATSREKLALRSETVYAISGLPFPDWDVPGDARAYSAVGLFIQSAQRTRPDLRRGQRKAAACGTHLPVGGGDAAGHSVGSGVGGYTVARGDRGRNQPGT
jgi:predicted ATPase